MDAHTMFVTNIKNHHVPIEKQDSMFYQWQDFIESFGYEDQSQLTPFHYSFMDLFTVKYEELYKSARTPLRRRLAVFYHDDDSLYEKYDISMKGILLPEVNSSAWEIHYKVTGHSVVAVAVFKGWELNYVSLVD